MDFLFQKVSYELLNSKRKEAYNFQKVSAVLAEYGFLTIRLSDDWEGADFLAQHISGETLKIQLKGRLYFSKKYFGKNLWVCFKDTNHWYLYPHDYAFEKINQLTSISNTESWNGQGIYHFPRLSKKVYELMESYILN